MSPRNDPPADDLDADGIPPDPIAALHDAVERLRRNMETLIERVEEVERRAAQLPEVPPRRGRGQRGRVDVLVLVVAFGAWVAVLLGACSC